MDSITRAVGKLAPFRSPKGNIESEVKFIQFLLSDALADCKGKVGSFSMPLTADGVCGRQTISAIVFFQQSRLKLGNVDGTLDPAGPTIKSLLNSVSLDKRREFWNAAVADTHFQNESLAKSVATKVNSQGKKLSLNVVRAEAFSIESYNIIDGGQKLTIEDTLNNSIMVRNGGSRSWRNNNPGNMRFSQFARNKGSIGSAGGFAVFISEEAGFSALIFLLKSASYRDLSLVAALNKYAPPSENNTDNYIKLIKSITGLESSVILSTLNDEKILTFAQAIQQIEGWVTGTVTIHSR